MISCGREPKGGGGDVDKEKIYSHIGTGTSRNRKQRQEKGSTWRITDGCPYVTSDGVYSEGSYSFHFRYPGDLENVKVISPQYSFAVMRPFRPCKLAWIHSQNLVKPIHMVQLWVWWLSTPEQNVCFLSKKLSLFDVNADFKMMVCGVSVSEIYLEIKQWSTQKFRVTKCNSVDLSHKNADIILVQWG